MNNCRRHKLVINDEIRSKKYILSITFALNRIFVKILLRTQCREKPTNEVRGKADKYNVAVKKLINA